jgi:hypothetical protein
MIMLDSWPPSGLFIGSVPWRRDIRIFEIGPVLISPIHWRSVGGVEHMHADIVNKNVLHATPQPQSSANRMTTYACKAHNAMAADFGLDCSDLDAALDATMRRAIYPASHALRKKGFASSFNTTRDPASNERCSVQLSSDIRASAIIVYSKQERNHSDSSEEIFDLDSEVDKSCKTFAYDDCFQVERSSPRDVHSVRALYNFRTGLMVSSELALEEKATSSVP